MKKMLAVVVSFALLLACMPGAWSEEYVSDVFSPRFFATVYNNSLLLARDEILAGRYDEETLDYLIENLILSYTETEEDTVYYDNVDGTSGLFAEYEGREVDVDEYAGRTATLACHQNGMSALVMVEIGEGHHILVHLC